MILYDYENNKISTETYTNEKGEYSFKEISQGKYVIIGKYDTNKYNLTKFKATGVIENKNSDFTTREITISGTKEKVGLTDVINVDKDIENIDIGLVEIKEFDMSIQKYLNKVTIQTPDGKTKIHEYNNKQFGKVEVHAKQIDGAIAVIEYKIVVKNNSEIPGKVGQILDEKPNGLEFYSELNPDWYEKDGILYTSSLLNKELKQNEEKEVKLILVKNLKNDNIGTISNIAKIGVTTNDKGIEDLNKENDYSKAELIISISTGIITYIGVIFGILITLYLILLVYKNRKKIIKIFSKAFSIGIVCFIFVLPTINVQGLTIKGVDTTERGDDGKYGVTAIGSDGVTYTCADGNFGFCDDHDHPVINTVISGGGIVSTTEWTTETLQIDDNTIKENVKITTNGEYNKIGPFNISSNKPVQFNMNMVYETTSGEGWYSLTSDIISGQDFYINITKNIKRINFINISASYTYTSTRTVTYGPGTVIHQTDLAPGDCSGGSRSCGVKGTQPMSAPTPGGDQTESEEKTTSAEIQILGPWTPHTNLIINKRDFDNTNKPLKGVEIMLVRGSDVNAKKYMIVTDEWGNQLKTLGNSYTSTILTFNHNAYNTDYVSQPTKFTYNGKTYTVYFDTSREKATRIITGNDGRIVINNLKLDTYTVVEGKSNNYGYDDNAASGTQWVQNSIPCGDSNFILTNIKQTGNLHIEKRDAQNENILLPNVKFRLVYNGQFVRVMAQNQTNWASSLTGTNHIINMTTTPNANEATIFITDAQGQITLYNILKGTYSIQEIDNPNYGYIVDSGKYINHNAAFYLSGTTPTNNSININRKPSGQTESASGVYDWMKVTNLLEYTRLSGTVWEENNDSKNNKGDNKYTKGTDALMEGIKVMLYKNNTLVATTKTNYNGYYEFGARKANEQYVNSDYWNGVEWSENGNLRIIELNMYHIEYEYDGLKYTTVLAEKTINTNVSTNSYGTEVATQKENDSYRKLKNRDQINKDFTEIVQGYAKNGERNNTYELKYKQ